MKKILSIELVVLLLFLCGCETKTNKVETQSKDEESQILQNDETEEENKELNETDCFYYKPDSFFPDTSSTLYSIYYDNSYNAEKEIVVFSYDFHTLDEAIENYEFHKKTCDESNENGLFYCTVERDNKTVSTIYYDFNVYYDYKDKIKELESNGYECNEK